MSGVKGMRHGIRKREDNITNRRIRRTKIICPHKAEENI